MIGINNSICYLLFAIDFTDFEKIPRYQAMQKTTNYFKYFEVFCFNVSKYPIEPQAISLLGNYSWNCEVTLIYLKKVLE